MHRFNNEKFHCDFHRTGHPISEILVKQNISQNNSSETFFISAFVAEKKLCFFVLSVSPLNNNFLLFLVKEEESNLLF